MRELIYIRDRKVAWRDRPDPVLEARTDAIVRPVAATTCDVDKTIIAGKSPFPPPFAVGHECVAMLVPLPPGLDPIAMASASDNWSLAWRLVAPHLQWTPGGRVLILSGGHIGLYVYDIALTLGASQRLYVDRDPTRRAIAERYGAPDRRVQRADPPRVRHRGRGDGAGPSVRDRLPLARPRGDVRPCQQSLPPGRAPAVGDVSQLGEPAHRTRQRPRQHPAALHLAQSGTRVSDACRLARPRLETLPDALPEMHSKAGVRPRSRRAAAGRAISTSPVPGGP